MSKKTRDEFSREKAYEREVAILAFTERIVELMQEQGLKRSDLAKAMGVTKPAITKLLDGANFTFETACALALAVNGHFVPEVRSEALLSLHEPADESAAMSGAQIYQFPERDNLLRTSEAMDELFEAGVAYA